jgi:hypothetical protein
MIDKALKYIFMGVPLLIMTAFWVAIGVAAVAQTLVFALVVGAFYLALKGLTGGLGWIMAPSESSDAD